MTDIMERLRVLDIGPDRVHCILDEAADEIERLRKLNVGLTNSHNQYVVMNARLDDKIKDLQVLADLRDRQIADLLAEVGALRELLARAQRGSGIFS